MIKLVVSSDDAIRTEDRISSIRDEIFRPDCFWLIHPTCVAQSRLHPPLPALGEDGLEVAFEEGAGVLEVLFGVGFGGGETRKRFVQDADDPLLLGEGWDW